MEKSNIGLIGLAVMGENLALNIEGHGYQVSLYNRPHRSGPEMVDVFLENRRIIPSRIQKTPPSPR